MFGLNDLQSSNHKIILFAEENRPAEGTEQPTTILLSTESEAEVVTLTGKGLKIIISAVLWISF